MYSYFLSLLNKESSKVSYIVNTMVGDDLAMQEGSQGINSHGIDLVVM